MLIALQSLLTLIAEIWILTNYLLLLHLILHYFDQQEVHCDVTLYLHPASAGDTEFTLGLLTNQI